jgi:hypothetical protein
VDTNKHNNKRILLSKQDFLSFSSGGDKKEMGFIEGYIIIGKIDGVKHYFLHSSKSWTTKFANVSLNDIHHKKLEIDNSCCSHLDEGYDYEKIMIDGNFTE